MDLLRTPAVSRTTQNQHRLPTGLARLGQRSPTPGPPATCALPSLVQRKPAVPTLSTRQQCDSTGFLQGSGPHRPGAWPTGALAESWGLYGLSEVNCHA